MNKEQGDNLRAGFIKLDPWSNARGRNHRVYLSDHIETATLHAGTCTELGDNLQPRFIKLDPWSNAERVEYHSDHRDGYTPCRHTHKEKEDNLLAGFIKLDPWNNACGKGRVPQ